MVEVALEWFGSLPVYLKFLVGVALLMPFLLLYNYTHPKPPAIPPPDIDIILPDGRRARGYMRGADVYVKKPPPPRR